MIQLMFHSVDISLVASDCNSRAMVTQLKQAKGGRSKCVHTSTRGMRAIRETEEVLIAPDII